MAGSHDDAMLMVELAKWGAMSGVPDAARAIFAADFDPDAVDANDPSINTLLAFNETVATLVKNGLLDADLVKDWLWMAGIWAKVGPAAKRAREKTGASQLYENFEALAAGQPA